jgi:hypothetical protein
MDLEELKFGIRLRGRNQNHSQIKINIPSKNRRTKSQNFRQGEIGTKGNLTFFTEIGEYIEILENHLPLYVTMPAMC